MDEPALELARHCFRYNDSSTYDLNKLSTQDIAGDIQCTTRTVQKLRKLWEKTKDVEKLCERGGMPKSLDEHIEQAIVQIFNDFVYTEVLPCMNTYSEDRPLRFVLIMDNAKIYCSEELQQICNEVGVLRFIPIAELVVGTRFGF
jgi:hypothetical protein